MCLPQGATEKYNELKCLSQVIKASMVKEILDRLRVEISDKLLECSKLILSCKIFYSFRLRTKIRSYDSLEIDSRMKDL